MPQYLYYDVVMDMVAMVADGEVSHAFLYTNDFGMRECIFDEQYLRSQVVYDAELGSSLGQDNDDEYRAYTSEEDDDDDNDDEEEQQQG